MPLLFLPGSSEFVCCCVSVATSVEVPAVLFPTGAMAKVFAAIIAAFLIVASGHGAKRYVMLPQQSLQVSWHVGEHCHSRQLRIDEEFTTPTIPRRYLETMYVVLFVACGVAIKMCLQAAARERSIASGLGSEQTFSW